MFLYLLRTCSISPFLLLYLMITNTKTYITGWAFVVPTVDKIKAYGCRHAYGEWIPPESVDSTISISDVFLSRHAGKILHVSTLYPSSLYKGWYDTEEHSAEYVHVEMCEVISSQTKGASVTWTSATTGSGYILPVEAWSETGLVYNAVGTNHHQCIEGKTPIFGKIICKDCGKDIRDF